MSNAKEKRILEFISSFRNDRYKDIKKAMVYNFTNNVCYWFAYILKTQFDGEIMYVDAEGHFVCKIDDKLYDINGEYKTEEEVYTWEQFQEMEQLGSERIKKWCIELIDTVNNKKMKGKGKEND